MPAFQDKVGRNWNITIDGPTIRRIAAESDNKWNLANTEQAFDATNTDSVGDWYEILWHVISPQAKERGIGAEQFARDIADSNGLFLLRARFSLWESWVEYLAPNSPFKPTMLRAIETTRRVVNQYIQNCKKEKRDVLS